MAQQTREKVCFCFFTFFFQYSHFLSPFLSYIGWVMKFLDLFYSNNVTPGDLLDVFKGPGSRRSLNANFEFRGSEAATPLHHIARLGFFFLYIYTLFCHVYENV